MNKKQTRASGVKSENTPPKVIERIHDGFFLEGSTNTIREGTLYVVNSDSINMRGIDLIGQGFIRDANGNIVIEEGLYSFIIEERKAIIEPVPLSRQQDTEYSKKQEEVQLKNRIDPSEALRAIPPKKNPVKKKKNGK